MTEVIPVMWPDLYSYICVLSEMFMASVLQVIHSDHSTSSGRNDLDLETQEYQSDDCGITLDWTFKLAISLRLDIIPRISKHYLGETYLLFIRDERDKFWKYMYVDVYGLFIEHLHFIHA